MYLKFVDSRGLKYSELKSCFSVFGLKSKLQTLAASRQSLANIDAFDFIRSELENTARLQLGSAINTESNLTSKVFSNIATSLNINIAGYTSRFNLIDESLVHRRNKIAHVSSSTSAAQSLAIFSTRFCKSCASTRLTLRMLHRWQHTSDELALYPMTALFGSGHELTSLRYQSPTRAFRLSDFQ